MPKPKAKGAAQTATSHQQLTISFYQAGPGDQGDYQAAFPGSTLLRPGKKGMWASLQTNVAAAIRKKSTSSEDLFAIFPSSFGFLTGLHQESLQIVLRESPGRDLYFFNLNPFDEAIFPNPWSRLFLEVKGMEPLMELVLKAVGEGQSQVNHLRWASEFHSFPAAIGTSMFWMGFFSYVDEIANKVLKDADPDAQRLLAQPVESNSGHHSSETYRGLLCRQLFPFFLRQEAANLKAIKLPVPLREQTLNIHVRTLRQLREASVRSNAPWLAAAWLNYRNLYLLGANGRAWCDQNLSVISPRLPSSAKLAGEAV